MKIAVVAPTHLPAYRANTIQVMKMSAALAGLGHTVRVAVPGLPSRPVGLQELQRHYGVEQPFAVDWLPAKPQLRRYDYGWRALRWAQSWGAELIYTRLPQAAVFASQAGFDTILEVHDMPQGLLGPVMLRLFLRGRGARRMVVITNALAEDLQRAYPIPSSNGFLLVAPDGVDLERYANLPVSQAARRALAGSGLELDPNRFTVGYTGSLYAGRGTGLIYELAALLPDVTFLLVGGEASEVKTLKQLAAERGLVNLALTGFVPNLDLPLYQAACDALLMPYQAHVAASSGGDIARYLSPMKLFEYLASGRPVLASDLPVLQEVLTPRNALLLPATDAVSWAKAIRDLQSDSQRAEALGNQARLVVAQHSWSKRAASVLLGLVK